MERMKLCITCEVLRKYVLRSVTDLVNNSDREAGAGARNPAIGSFLSTVNYCSCPARFVQTLSSLYSDRISLTL